MAENFVVFNQEAAFAAVQRSCLNDGTGLSLSAGSWDTSGLCFLSTDII